MNRIKQLRLEKEWTQGQLAEKINKSDRTVGFYESGERDPDTDTLDKLANIFDVSVDYLLGRTDIRKPKTYPKNSLLGQVISEAEKMDEEELKFFNEMIDRMKKK